jgi:hypothetical protein
MGDYLPPTWDYRWFMVRRPPVDATLRASHDDRSKVADTLSKHYADGRLDDTEFKERVDRALNAKTRGELDGLMGDLPRTEEPPQRSHRFRHLVVAAVFVLLALSAISVLTPPHFPWLILVVVALLFARRVGWHHRHDHHRPLDRW